MINTRCGKKSIVMDDKTKRFLVFLKTSEWNFDMKWQINLKLITTGGVVNTFNACVQRNFSIKFAVFNLIIKNKMRNRFFKIDHAENCEVTLWQRNDNYSPYTDFKSDDNLNTGITRNRIILNLTTRNFFRYAI